ncbi:LOW QUALITY PROTEIN: uncharacterized protein LOC127795603 [Diospyros lotus]|uniref:LOW QUALITY PROTEIN: uncharacterized protein LOC127795603 n=1 Tax=Diospyros lotus TaxID=55363 RepID=UPI002251BD30|nr:LOW QUALITY PROTEIN: uncharacterized protein LOC127795603 [Diospyros lotus]
MLDGLLGRGFSSKCKSLIKQTRIRIDVLRRRQEATQRFLKGNLAQLLTNGLDINAFGRTEEYLAGQNLLSCYDFIEQSCEYMVKQLSLMQKQRECPEECREVVGSLMFAAARFSDFPELRDLRDTFQERYGTCLEHFVNHEFVEKLSSRPAKMEKKIQLLEEIALEFSIKWDSRGFEQRMCNPSAFAQEQPKKYGPVNDHEDKYTLPNGTDKKKDKLSSYSSKDKRELTGQKHKVQNALEDNQSKRNEFDQQLFGREELIGRNHKPQFGSEQTIPRRDKHGIPLGGRRELADDKCDLSLTNGEDGDPKRGRPGSSFRGKRPDFVDNGYEVHSNRVNNVTKGSARAPHLMQNQKMLLELQAFQVGVMVPLQLAIMFMANQTLQPQQEKFRRKNQIGQSPSPVMPSLRPISNREINWSLRLILNRKIGNMELMQKLKLQVLTTTRCPWTLLQVRETMQLVRQRISMKRILNSKDQIAGTAGPNHHGHERDSPYWDNVPLPKPKSMRRKHPKSSSSRDDAGNSEDAGVVKRRSSSRRRDDSRRGLQILFDDHRRTDEEERVIDKLLLHYSSKPSTYGPEKVTRKSKAHALHQRATDTGDNPHRSRDGPDLQVEVASPPNRSVSLPREQTTPAEPVKVFTRANSFQPDQPAKHVHPKLPDYDDLAARFAALKGR